MKRAESQLIRQFTIQWGTFEFNFLSIQDACARTI